MVFTQDDKKKIMQAKIIKTLYNTYKNTIRTNHTYTHN